MSSMTYSQKMFKPTAPDKGSFPLDHEGECRQPMLLYMNCLLGAGGDSSACRETARAYLACRMERGLMTSEAWPKLGFHEYQEPAPSPVQPVSSS